MTSFTFYIGVVWSFNLERTPVINFKKNLVVSGPEGSLHLKRKNFFTQER